MKVACHSHIISSSWPCPVDAASKSKNKLQRYNVTLTLCNSISIMCVHSLLQVHAHTHTRTPHTHASSFPKSPPIIVKFHVWQKNMLVYHAFKAHVFMSWCFIWFSVSLRLTLVNKRSVLLFHLENLFVECLQLHCLNQNFFSLTKSMYRLHVRERGGVTVCVWKKVLDLLFWLVLKLM